MLTVYTLRQQ